MSQPNSGSIPLDFSPRASIIADVVKSICASATMFFLSSILGAAETKPAPVLRPLGDLLVERIVQEMRTPDTDPAVFDEELRGIDTFLNTRPGDRSRDVAQVRFTQAVLIGKIKRDPARGMALLESIATDFAGTDVGTEMMPHLRREWSEQAKMKKLAEMIGQPAPDLEFDWSSDPAIHSLADLNGRVVVIDFWTTFDAAYGAPYGKAFPAIRELVARYRGRPFTYVGVTCLEGGIHGVDEYVIRCDDDPDHEHALMRQFMEKNGVSWTVAFADESTYLSAFAISLMPHTVILGADGTVRRSDAFAAIPLEERTIIVDHLLEE